MKISFLGQGYEGESDNAVGKRLIEYLKRTDFRSFTGISAFASEAENVLLPYHKDNDTLLPKIDLLIRNKVNIEDVLKITNEVILKEHYGLTQKEIKLAHGIWKKLSSRRLNRGK